MKPSASSPISVSLDGTEIVIRIQAATTQPDELVEVSKCGIEGAAKLVASGALKAVRIGRRLYCRRSDLVALVDRLPAAKSKKTKPPTSTKPNNVFSFADAAKEASK